MLDEKTTRLRILVAEDDLVSRTRLVHDLEKWGFDVFGVGNGTDALDLLTSPDSKVDLAILDWMMPGVDGRTVCERVRKLDSGRYIYLIMLSGKVSKDEIVEGLDSGADDYLPKPYNAQELLSRIRAAERIIHLQEELREANVRMRALAETDSLTGLMNRRVILQRLTAELSRAERTKSPIAVAMADIDHFKAVNDTYGHGAGDEVLREFARRLIANRRTYDAIGRYGGEEFVLIFPEASPDALYNIIERIRCSVAANPIQVGDTTIDVTASFGACWVGGGTECTDESILRCADKLLYDAKEQGRNRVVARPYEETEEPAPREES